jgi:hypothetical protein
VAANQKLDAALARLNGWMEFFNKSVMQDGDNVSAPIASLEVGKFRV